MAQLSDILPQTSVTVQAIYDHYKKVGDSQKSRGYLGASIIGHPCERYLWYNFRNCCIPSIDGRTYRLFDTGNKEEARFCKDLIDIGVEVHELGEHGKQFEVHALGGHLSGHMDGCAVGIPEAPKTWHVLEFKTHNAKSFAKLTKDGVEKSKPQHYAQMQIYMHLSGMTRALYLAKNKDNDELYSERVRYDKAFCLGLMDRAERIITFPEPPARISTMEDFYECSWCDAHAICWGSPDKPALPVLAISCKQCCHATPKMDGIARWECEKHHRSLSETEQSAACNDHLCLPGLFSFARPIHNGIDTNGEWIEFTFPDCAVFQHGNGAGKFSTRELMALPASKLNSSLVAEAKEVFGATVTSVDSDGDILSRYPVEDSEILFQGPIGLCREKWWQLYDEDLDKMQPLQTYTGFYCKAAEYEGGRCVILWNDMQQIGARNCEIRKGKE